MIKNIKRHFTAWLDRLILGPHPQPEHGPGPYIVPNFY